MRSSGTSSPSAVATSPLWAADPSTPDRLMPYGKSPSLLPLKRDWKKPLLPIELALGVRSKSSTAMDWKSWREIHYTIES